MISIIALLIAMLLPSLSQARRAAQNVVCLSNLRQIGLASITWGEDYDTRMPPAGWIQDPRLYNRHVLGGSPTEAPAIFTCPSEPELARGYAVNLTLASKKPGEGGASAWGPGDIYYHRYSSHKRDDVQSPSLKIWMTDSAGGASGYYCSPYATTSYRHGNPAATGGGPNARANVLHIDGNVGARARVWVNTLYHGSSTDYADYRGKYFVPVD